MVFVYFLEIAAKLSGFRCRFKMATDEGPLPKIAQYSPCQHPLKFLLLPKDPNFFSFFLFRFCDLKCVFVKNNAPNCVLAPNLAYHIS